VLSKRREKGKGRERIANGKKPKMERKSELQERGWVKRLVVGETRNTPTEKQERKRESKRTGNGRENEERMGSRCG
jgi:hypothetical protein